jgi:hypothetical protein
LIIPPKPDTTQPTRKFEGKINLGMHVRFTGSREGSDNETESLEEATGNSHVRQDVDQRRVRAAWSAEGATG